MSILKSYSLITKFFYQTVFKLPYCLETLYFINKFFFLKKNNSKNKHIFILGFPRSGTTKFLQMFPEKDFSKLSYEYMPFILSPHLNRGLKFILYPFKKKKKKFKRFHSDKMIIDENTAEGLEEIFFNRLNKKEFKNYINLILNYTKKKRYISKNNYSFKRIDFIKKTFKNSMIFVLFRSPTQHVMSTIANHQIFKKLHTHNPFLLEYMNLTFHNEFGIGHKSYIKGKNNNFDDSNYWLEQWLLYYKNILSMKKDYYLIDYKDLFSKNFFLNKLSIKIDITLFNNSKFRIKKRNYNLKFDKDLLSESNLIYKKLQKLSKQKI